VVFAQVLLLMLNHVLSLILLLQVVPLLPQPLQLSDLSLLLLVKMDTSLPQLLLVLHVPLLLHYFLKQEVKLLIKIKSLLVQLILLLTQN